MEDPLYTSTNSAINCKFCKEQFTNSQSICHHLIFNHFRSLNRCLICSRIFTEVHQLNKHVTKHSTASKVVFKCSSCTMSFYSKVLLKKHEFKHENTDPNNGIYLDDLNTSLTEILRMNIKDFIKNVHVRKPKYNCVSCKTILSDSALYLQHLKETHLKSIDNNDNKIFVCDACCAVYNNKGALANHIYRKHKSKRQVFKCDYCKKEFDEKIYLTLHVRAIHKIYKCSKCNNEYIKNKCYLQHLPKCLGRRQKKLFRCVDCNIIFKTPNDLYAHNQICNQRMLDIKDCQFCGITFPNGEKLKVHEQRHKLKIATYKYQCFYCELRFCVPLRLIQHFAGKHRAEKPFKCNICDVTFKKRKEFTYHIKLNHKMEGTMKIDNANSYILFNARNADHPREQEETLLTLSEIQTDDTSGTNIQLRNLTNKNNDCTIITENKDGNTESCISNWPESDSIPIATNNAILQRNLCRVSPDLKSNLGNKSTESLTVDKNDELCEFHNKKVSISNLKKNLVTRHGGRSCFICKQDLKMTESLSKHIKNHFRAQIKSCSKCVATFEDQQSLENHILKMHPNNGGSTIINVNSKISVRNVPDIDHQIGNQLKNINNGVILKSDMKKKNIFKVNLKSVAARTNSAMNLRKYIESFSSNKSNCSNINLPSPSSNVVLKRIIEPIDKGKKFTLQTVQISSNLESYISNSTLAKPVKFTNNAKPKFTNQLSSNAHTNIDLKFNTQQANTTNHATEETSKMVDMSYHKYLKALENRETPRKQKKERGKIFDYVSIIASELSDSALGLKKK